MSQNTILLKADALSNQNLREERVANAAITPGHFVELMSTNKVRVHATAGGAITPLIACEDSYSGGTIDTAYAASGRVFLAWLREGDEVQARLANGETAAIGSKLESYGDGTLRVVDTDTSAGTVKIGSIIATALEAVDMSSSSGADPAGLIRVKITRG